MAEQKTLKERLNDIKQIVPASKSLLSNESYCWYPAKDVEKILFWMEDQIGSTKFEEQYKP